MLFRSLRSLHPVDRSQIDPVWWARTVLGFSPWSKQAEILRSVAQHSRTSVRSCHGAGKSAIAAVAVLWFVLNRPFSKVATTAPTMRQVERILWSELRKAYQRAPGHLGGTMLRTRLELDDDWFAFGFTASDQPGGAAEGLHSETGSVLIVVDEAAGVSAQTYEALEGALSGEGSRLLEIGNPTDPLSQFARNQKTPGTHVMRITAFDTPNFTGECRLPGLVTPEWVEDKRHRWGEGSPLWRARVDAEFPEISGNVLIPLPWIEAAQRRTLERADGPPRLAFDVADEGGDENVLGAAWGPVFRVAESWTDLDPMQSAGRVIRGMVAHRASAVVVDVVGIGSGPAARIREITGDDAVIDCSGGRKAHDSENFANLRTEIFWNLRLRFQRGEIDIDADDHMLMAQLASLQVKPTSDGRLMCVPKAKTRKLLPGLGSPDRADACAMAYYTPPDRYDGIGLALGD